MWPKACTRCSGDLYLERLLGSDEIACLNCGHRFELRPGSYTVGKAGRTLPKETLTMQDPKKGGDAGRERSA